MQELMLKLELVYVGQQTDPLPMFYQLYLDLRDALQIQMGVDLSILLMILYLLFLIIELFAKQNFLLKILKLFHYFPNSSFE